MDQAQNSYRFWSPVSVGFLTLLALGIWATTCYPISSLGNTLASQSLVAMKVTGTIILLSIVLNLNSKEGVDWRATILRTTGIWAVLTTMSFGITALFRLI